MRAAPRLFLRFLTPTDRELGLAGERVAARHLRALGWRLLARRLKTASGELDLVADDGSFLVGVEVKSGRRAGPRFRPGHRVDRERLRRLWRATRALARGARRRARVDLIEVVLEQGIPRVVHHRGLREPLD